MFSDRWIVRITRSSERLQYQKNISLLREQSLFTRQVGPVQIRKSCPLKMSMNTDQTLTCHMHVAGKTYFPTLPPPTKIYTAPREKPSEPAYFPTVHAVIRPSLSTCQATSDGESSKQGKQTVRKQTQASKRTRAQPGCWHAAKYLKFKMGHSFKGRILINNSLECRQHILCIETERGLIRGISASQLKNMLSEGVHYRPRS